MKQLFSDYIEVIPVVTLHTRENDNFKDDNRKQFQIRPVNCSYFDIFRLVFITTLQFSS